MAVVDAYVFPGFLTPVLTQLFFPKPPTTFLTCFCRGERQKYAGKKSRLNRGSNSQPPGLESNTLTFEPPRQGENILRKEEIARNEQFLLFLQCFLLNQIIVSLFVHIFDIISLFAAELEQPKIGIWGKGLTLSQTSPGLYGSAIQTFWKHRGKRRNCSLRAISPFPSVFSIRLKNFLPISSNLKLSSTNSFNLEESKIYHMGKGK